MFAVVTLTPETAECGTPKQCPDAKPSFRYLRKLHRLALVEHVDGFEDGIAYDFEAFGT